MMQVRCALHTQARPSLWQAGLPAVEIMVELPSSIFVMQRALSK
jgi:hypothetical protein